MALCTASSAFLPLQMGRENGPERRAFALHRYPFFEGFYDDVTGFPLIFAVDFASVILRVQGMVP